MGASKSFHSMYDHGFVRVASAVPNVRPAEPAFNAERTLGLARRASDDDAALVIFPELGLTGYAIDDLHHQQAVLAGAIDAIARIRAESTGLRPVIIVGAPLPIEGGLFNCAIVI